MCSWSKDDVLEFIQTYRTLPCLWDVRSKDYSNKYLKENAYKVLIEQVRLFDDNASRDVVLKKINNLRTTFRKELKKVDASRKAGASYEDEYVPCLWYYPHLLFLVDEEVSRQGAGPGFDSLDAEELSPFHKQECDTASTSMYYDADYTTNGTNGHFAENDINSNNNNNHNNNTYLHQDDHPTPHHSSSSLVHASAVADVSRRVSARHSPSSPAFMAPGLSASARRFNGSGGGGGGGFGEFKPTLKRKRLDNDEHQSVAGSVPPSYLLPSPGNNPSSQPSPPAVKEDDEHDATGKAVAHKLRGLGFEQRLHAELLISQVLYEAAFQNLSRQSRLVVGTGSVGSNNSNNIMVEAGGGEEQQEEEEEEEEEEGGRDL